LFKLFRPDDEENDADDIAGGVPYLVGGGANPHLTNREVGALERANSDERPGGAADLPRSRSLEPQLADVGDNHAFMLRIPRRGSTPEEVVAK